MSDRTQISWTDATWSPVTGCTRVSEGCLNCYIERTVPFRVEGRRFHLPVIGGTTGVRLHPDRLEQPLRWRKPRRIFVCSMADLFHEDVPDEYIAKVFAVMSQAPQHSFQVLTKRHARMRSLLSSDHFQSDAHSRAIDLVQNRTVEYAFEWPLPNVWLGVSVESQKWADWRIPSLLDTPAAVRWLSCEPLLGPVDLEGPVDQHGHRPRLSYWLTGRPAWTPDGVQRSGLLTEQIEVGPRIDWVVAGGESGPGARPMHPDWARSLRDQCVAAGVPFHFKQHGEWAPIHAGGHPPFDYVTDDDRCQIVDIHGQLCGRPWMGWAVQDGTRDAVAMRKYGKSKAGRLLDGRTWDEYPAVAAEVSGGAL